MTCTTLFVAALAVGLGWHMSKYAIDLFKTMFNQKPTWRTAVVCVLFIAFFLRCAYWFEVYTIS